jgi:hypothetical protein
MKRPTMLVKAILADASLDLDLSVERDAKNISRRCEHEGLSFLTLTLPTLSDALERGIESGTFTCPTSFSRHGSLPRLLGGFFKRVFTKDGRLLLDPCARSVFWIRQICRFFKKPKMKCSDSRNRAAEASFLAIEGELRRMTPQIERKDILLDKISGILWSQVFPEPDYLDLVCHHGPGVTADRRLSNERCRISKWYHRSELTYPSDLHCYPNYGYAAVVGSSGTGTAEFAGPEYVAIRDELPVRVVFVPKTLAAPRVIAIEPSNVQFMQQSLKDYVYRILEEHRLTKLSIHFKDQSINQRLAYRSSIDKRLATLDLKDASDRVHLHLVQRIFKTSGILEYLEDARSLHATLPSGRNIVLFKYASMGSALCFPVEAMVFYTLVQCAMHQLDGRRPSSRSIRDYSRQIDIYGDDIIVPVEYTDVVVRYLESYALKVNVNKSFRNSHFRESCGADFYNGTPVNPVYARTEPHDNLRHWGAEDVMSWNATADLCYLRGMWKTCQAIRDLLCRVVRRTIPKSSQLGSGLFFFSLLYNTDLRYNRDLCGWKQKRIHYDPIKRKDSIDGDELACFNKWGQSVHASTVGRDHSDHHTVSCLVTRLQDGREPVRTSPSRAEHVNPDVVTSFSETSVSDLSSRMQALGDTLPLELCPMDEDRYDCSAEGSRQVEGRELETICMGSSICVDPLEHLTGRSEGLTFTYSTKRGSFKSKCRWVSLAG